MLRLHVDENALRIIKMECDLSRGLRGELGGAFDRLIATNHPPHLFATLRTLITSIAQREELFGLLREEFGPVGLCKGEGEGETVMRFTNGR